jgi:23S rRNA (uracil1939-C5)-methyltransferase
VATFTRDLTDFIAAGFKVVELQPLDQFPHTPHIEIMAWLER